MAAFRRAGGMALLRKTSPRRDQVRRNIAAERSLWCSRLMDADVVISLLLWLVFVVLCIGVLSFGLAQQGRYRALAASALIVVFAAIGGGLYAYHYQKRLLRNHAKALALVVLFPALLAVTKLGSLSSGDALWGLGWGVGTAVLTAIILVIAYDQRFAIGMSALYCVLASLAVGPKPDQAFQLQGMRLFLTMITGAGVCCFTLKEIRTRMKLLEVSALAAAVVFLTAMSVPYLNFLGEPPKWITVFQASGYYACAAFLAGLLMQSLLPLIEKLFHIATSMTLLDYSDANQVLLKKLAMEAPGTFSHSLLIGSIAEAAAEAIGCNGLLCRVGAYYHDIGKIDQSEYFIENQRASNKHDDLKPSLSAAVIRSHVKLGVEKARELFLPEEVTDIISQHHGRGLIRYFYNRALEGADGKNVSVEDYSYPGIRPQSREAAVVMLADAVDAASRVLRKPTIARLEKMVLGIVMDKFSTDELSESNITLRDLETIQKSFVQILAGYFHSRIEYPRIREESARQAR